MESTASMREIGRCAVRPGERINFNRATIESIRSLHDPVPPGVVTLADGIFAAVFHGADGREIRRISEPELPLPDGDPISPEGAVELRWLLERVLVVDHSC